MFNGFQTANRTRAAESQVSSARETLRNTEQSVLLSALTAYMNVLRDYATLELQKRNVEVLQEQLRQTRDRFKVGDVTSHRYLASGDSIGLRGNAGRGRGSKLQDLRCHLSSGHWQ